MNYKRKTYPFHHFTTCWEGKYERILRYISIFSSSLFCHSHGLEISLSQTLQPEIPLNFTSIDRSLGFK